MDPDTTSRLHHALLEQASLASFVDPDRCVAHPKVRA